MISEKNKKKTEYKKEFRSSLFLQHHHPVSPGFPSKQRNADIIEREKFRDDLAESIRLVR